MYKKRNLMKPYRLFSVYAGSPELYHLYLAMVCELLFRTIFGLEHI